MHVFEMKIQMKSKNKMSYKLRVYWCGSDFHKNEINKVDKILSYIPFKLKSYNVI